MSDADDYELKRWMLLIKTLDPGAHLCLSEFTQKWYVSAKIEVGNGATLASGGNHGSCPYYAVQAYFDWLVNLKPGEFIVTKAYTNERREWRWNGAGFVEQPRRSAAVSS